MQHNNNSYLSPVGTVQHTNETVSVKPFYDGLAQTEMMHMRCSNSKEVVLGEPLRVN